jgi:hypothetical protein
MPRVDAEGNDIPARLASGRCAVRRPRDSAHWRCDFSDSSGSAA